MSLAERQEIWLWSPALERHVSLTILLPPNTDGSTQLSILILNDGQDFDRLQLPQTLRNLFEKNTAPQPFLIAGIHCNEDRMNEYGTASQADYAGRGSRAKNHTNFVVNELLPFLRQQFRCRTEQSATAIAGFSLGGLSAIDIAWANGKLFGKVGIFSGSLWWRSQPFVATDPDGHRIMHDLIRNTASKNEGMKFWLEAGTNDEKDDRNGNGIIDAIDDTLDLIRELKQKGYEDHDIRYVEVAGGEHNPDTWGKVMPAFLHWAFGN